MGENVRALTCVCCPNGCRMRVKYNSKGDIEEVTGNTCKRGEVFAHDEAKNPRRNFSTTIPVEGSKIVTRLAVKTH